MKALVLEDINKLKYREIRMPEPLEGEVLVRVHACGICGSDIPRAYRDGAHNMPLIPGHEFSGEVVKTGEAVSRNWTGKRVGVFRIDKFYEKLLGIKGVPDNEETWLSIDDDRFAHAVNGEVFLDGPGVFSAVREELLKYYPDSVFKIEAFRISIFQIA